jgi:hypothetical protein
MATRTVRLDKDAEKVMARLRKITGLSISELLKRGLMAYQHEAMKTPKERPYDIYRRLDLGEGGHALAPGREAKSAVVKALKSKHGR